MIIKRKTPEQIEEDIRQYKFKRFEDYMQMADEGVLTRALAITAFQEELESPIALWKPGDKKYA